MAKLPSHFSLFVSNTNVYLFSFKDPPDYELSAGQILIMKQTMNKVRESVHRLAADHRDLHSTVSKVGKAIDRVSLITFINTSLKRGQ